MIERHTWAIIAINARARCKTRLDATLGQDGRRQLMRRMVGHVLDVVRAVPVIDEVLVVSPERDSVPPDVNVLHDSGTDLNAAFDAGRRAALAAGATGLVLLPADLPLLSCADLEQLLVAGVRAGVAIAPDRKGSGTNGLYVSLERGARMCFAFGPGSRERHEAEAQACGYRAQVVASPGLQADIDTRADYDAVFGVPGARPAQPVGALL
jgi:2-phospho-L-lactate/phosphoenolpyruvate guanylyltransferase